MNAKVSILGGGIAGISAAYHAKILGIKSECFEAADTLGGLTGGFVIEGFHFDNAIHMSFTNDSYVRSIFDKTPYIKHKPDAYCYDNGLWLKHPVQNNLYALPAEEKVACIESFIERPQFEAKNYREWLVCQYGEYISNKYPIPYTRKYWGLEPDNLSLSWIGSRMRRAELKEVLGGAFERKDDNHYYANEMRYPESGGYFSFVKNVADQIDIKLNKKVIKIDLENKTLLFGDGDIVKYHHLVSTLPLPVICDLIEGIPEEIHSLSKSLLWTTVDLISIGFNKADIPPYLWFYIYDETNLAARGYSPSLKSPSNAPEGCSSLQFEIYNLSGNKKFDPQALKKNVIEKLIQMKICKPEDIMFTHHKHLPFGNVVFDHGMESRRDRIRKYITDNGIISCGRFGEWDYLWSDQSFLSGKNAIDQLKAKDVAG